MRRIFATIGFTSFFTCIICTYFGARFSFFLAFVALIFLLISVFVKNFRKGAILLVLISTIVFSLNSARVELKVDEYKRIYCNPSTDISGVLLDYPEISKSGFNYTFRTDDENKVKFSLFCYDELDISPGDKIEGKFDFSDDYADLENSVYFSAYVYYNDTVKITSTDSFGVAQLRRYLKNGLNENMTVGRGLAKAITFGDLSGVSDEIYINLQRCGLLHATATSGLHLTIVTGFLFTVLSLFGITKKKSSIIVIAFVIMFMTVIGFRFSLVRAGIMMIMILSANLFDRDADTFNSIGLVLFILTLINPYCVSSCSLLLSVCATMGIVFTYNILSPFIQKHGGIDCGVIKRFFLSFGVGIVQSAGATLFTLPIVYIYFGYFSVAGILVNSILSPFITMVLIFGVLVCLLQFLPIIPYFLGALCDSASFVVLKVAEFFSKFEYCLVSVNYDFLAVAFAGCFIVIASGFLVYKFKKKDKNSAIRVVSLLCVNIILLSVLLNTAFDSNSVTLSVGNSGGAVSICVVEKGETFVIDCGGTRCDRNTSYQLNRYAKRNIDFLIMPRATDDGFSSTVLITKSLSTNKTYINTRLLDKAMYKINSPTENIEKIQQINYNKLKLQFVTLSRFTVVYITNGETSALLVDKAVDCKYIPKEFLSCDLLIVNNALPQNCELIKSKSAVIFSYEDEAIDECSKYFKTYSLKTKRIDVILSKKLKLRQV